MLRMRYITTGLLLAALSGESAAIVNPAAYERMEKDTKLSVREKINPLLEKYCGKFCQLVNVKVEIAEDAPISDDIGFEGVMGTTSQNQLFIRKIVTEIQIDNRVSSVNQERLGKILEIHLRSMAVEPQVQWLAVALPQIRPDDPEMLADPLPQPPAPVTRMPRQNNWNQEPEQVPPMEDPVATPPVMPAAPFVVDDSVEALVKNQLEARLMQAITKVTDKYCPDQCIIERLAIDGQMISASDARGFPATQIFKVGNGKAALRIEGIEIDVTIADAIDEAVRDQIVSLMRSHTKFAQPLNLNVSVTSFPETYAQKKDRTRLESEDPYGLERLRQMLTMFRELAGTKEIITNNSSTNTSESKTDSRSSNSSESSTLNRESSTSTNNSNSTNSATTSSTQRNNSSTNTNSSETGGVGGASGGITSEELAAYGAGFILLITLMALAIVKFSRANRDASEMMMAPAMGMPQGRRNAAGQGDDWAVGGEASAHAEGGATQSKTTSFSLGMKVKEMKDELLELFLEHPKVAKDTFSRFLKEDGVEETAKYVHVFGHLVIFQLLEDPNFQRELYDLSEYYHNSSFRFTQQEELDLLAKLKTRCTASEIRVLTRKELEKFDFLTKLDPSQIYTLMQDENLQVQSIVLAQLDPKRRRSVFDMYHGPMKIKLLSQLSASEAIPKEFMANVAKALAKKVSQKPEYDTENIRSSDVLLDLLEKAKLTEQRQLMATLQKQNPDTARSLKMKLVTVEMMPILKDGHLLELILGMDRRDLLVFLAGTGEHIRDLLLRKAPEELSDSWIEDLQTLGSVDEQGYRMVEMKVLNRIRNLANNGVISLMDINSMLFDNATNEAGEFRQEEPGITIRNSNFVAA